jgi:hypothetical protein
LPRSCQTQENISGEKSEKIIVFIVLKPPNYH